MQETENTTPTTPPRAKRTIGKRKLGLQKGRKTSGRDPRDPFPIVFRTVRGMARNLGVVGTTTRAWTLKPDFPGGLNGPWPLHEIIAWLRITAEKPESESSGNSPALERFREERAALARLERMEREGRLVDRQHLRGYFLGPVANQIQAHGERMQRRYGPGAGEEVAEMLESIMRTAKEFFGTNDNVCESDDEPESGSD